MQLDAVEAADAKRREGVVVLQAAELALNRGAAPVEITPPLRLAGNERMQSRRLPPETLGLAVPGGAAPFRSLVLEVRSGERPGAMLADWWEMLALFDGWGLAERDDREGRGLVAGVVDRVDVVALVERDGFWLEVAGLDGAEKPLAWLASCVRAVVMCHATGRSVWLHAAMCSLYP